MAHPKSDLICKLGALLLFCGMSKSKTPQAKATRNKADKRRRKRRRYARYIVEYGQEFADSYKAVCNVIPTHSKQRFLKLKLDHLEKYHEIRPGKHELHRIEALNRVAGLPMLNIGWRCMACSASTDIPWMFDIDHIIPSSAGGANKYFNLQILCPFCHQKKSLALCGFTKDQKFKIENELMARWSDKNYNGI